MTKTRQRKKGLGGEGDKENEGPEPPDGSCMKESVEETPHLPWKDFIQLLEENRNDAFELTAFVTLPNREPLSPLPTSHSRTISLSQSVREATGYRFK